MMFSHTYTCNGIFQRGLNYSNTPVSHTDTQTHSDLSHSNCFISCTQNTYWSLSLQSFSYCDTPSPYLPGQTETYSSLSHTHWSHTLTPTYPILSQSLNSQSSLLLLLRHTHDLSQTPGSLILVNLSHWHIYFSHTLIYPGSHSGFSQSSP